MTNLQGTDGAPQGGVKPGQEGLVLQRGGEELLLEKIVDRLTMRLANQAALPDLQAQIKPQSVQPIARGQLLEWTVPAHRLEAALTVARESPAVLFASHVYRLAVSRQTLVYLTEQVTVQFIPDISAQQEAAIIAEHQLALLKPLEGIPKAYVYQVTRDAAVNPIKIANRLMRLPQVLTAEPNIVVQTEPLYRPKDDLYGRQWHLFHGGGNTLAAGSHIYAEAAWNITRGSRSVVIAVSDDGFDLNHPDLQGMGKLVAPLDLKDRDAVPLPMTSDENHGTACAGLAIGEENGSGIVGVAPGCAFMPIRTTGFLDDDSIEYLFGQAAALGADVISCSWSPAAVYFPLSLRQQAAIINATTKGRNGKGTVVVFSAGNANRPVHGVVEEKGWPNNALQGKTEWLSGFSVHPDVITVSASTSLNRKAAYSNWGDHIAVAAPSNNGAPNMALPKLGSITTGPTIGQALPGLGMVTCDRTTAAGYDKGNYTHTFGGTSSACPVVAGVIGLMLSANPQLTAREVRQILQTTTDKIVDVTPDPQLGLSYGTYNQNGHSRWFGYGKVNALKAVQEAQRRAFTGRTLKQTLTYDNETPLTIPDGDLRGAASAIKVGESGQVQDIQVQVTLAHEFLSDISLTLVSPRGDVVLLQGRTLGAQTTLRQTYTLATTPTLTHLMGQPAAGLWQLRVIDHAPGATGQLQQWTLVLGI